VVRSAIAHLSAFAALSAAVACTGSSGTAGISPITGILVRSESLVDGRGCGEDASQLYRYAAVVEDDAGQAIAGGTYDCFADAGFTFGNVTPDGTRKYKVRVFAFNRVAYEAENRGRAIDTAGTNLAALRAMKATWTTDCEATPLPTVQVLAVCPALKSQGTSSATFLAQKLPSAGGGDLLCGNDFVKVRAALRGTGRVFEGDCTSALVLTDLPAPADATFDVSLLDAGGATKATSKCVAQTSPGLDASLVCKPFSTP
jgi:hypothetical protein